MKSLNDSIKESFEILLENISFKKPQGIASGYPNFDNILRGINKGNLTVLASKPSLGKTAFALNIIHNLTQCTPETGVLFCSDLSNTELTFRLLTIASGVKNSYDTDYRNEDMKRLTSTVNKLKEYPLYFEEHSGIDDTVMENIKTIHAAHNIELLIVDNIRPDDCRKLKELAKELDIAVLALVSLYSRKDEILSRGVADTLVILHRERKADYDPDLGAPVEFIVSKNKHGLCGTCRMYFIPEIMLYKESCAGDDPFVVIPEIYESITPYIELKRYLTPDNLPLLEHLHSEIPQNDVDTDPESLLRLSARLEAVGDHKNAVKVFQIGQKQCEHDEEKIECVYDLLHAAMYYWLFRRVYDMHSCMARAEQMLDEHSQREYDELKRRILTYQPSAWIKEEEIEE
jgi:predicted transcriptional regulator